MFNKNYCILSLFNIKYRQLIEAKNKEIETEDHLK